MESRMNLEIRNKYNKFLAKSDGDRLIEHLELTKDISKIYIEKLYPDLDKKYKIIAEYACLLHDVLKIDSKFQKYIDNEIEYEKQKFHHNEVGWAFLKMYLNPNFFSDKVDEFVNVNDVKKLICDSIYFHHGNNTFNNEHKMFEILSTITANDRNNIIIYINDYFGDNILITDNRLTRDDIPVPSLYGFNNTNNNSAVISELFLIKNILVSSDRLASICKTDTEALFKIDDIIGRKNTYILNNETVIKSKKINLERFVNQVNIVNQTEKITTLKAPAGFGKTMCGLLAGLRTNKKILWVCPTTTVTNSVYINLIDLSNNLGLNLNVQSFHGGEVKAYTHTENEFESDIIVLNIDAFLSRTYKQSDYKQEIIIANSYVIFDEFHEFVSDMPMFPIFIAIVNHRVKYSSEDTLLLSATPTPNFDSYIAGSKLKIMPNIVRHYPAVHDKKYYFEFIDDFSEIDSSKSTICFTGTVGNTQDIYRKDNVNNKLLVHSRYKKEIKENKLIYIINHYGKLNKKENKHICYTTSMLQSSVDISFENMAEATVSPESFMQSLGRCNRFGNFESSKVYLVNLTKHAEYSKGHTALITLKYSKYLHDKWHDFLRTNLEYGKGYTLNELYVLYNTFNNENYDRINELNNSFLERGKKRATNINIRRVYKIDEEGKNKRIKVNANPLRATSMEKFFTMMDTKGNFVNESFTKKIFEDSIESAFDIDQGGKTNNKHIEMYVDYMQDLTESSDHDFDYSKVMPKMKGRKNITKVRYTSELYNLTGNDNLSPILLFNDEYLYCEEYGILNLGKISKKLLH